jgi:hypothetical protein
MIERETRMTPFRQWAILNREHVKLVFAIHPDRQLEHEAGCAVCQEGLKADLLSFTGGEISKAVSDSVEVAKKVLVKRAKASE